ncbi:MAG: tetratricopeptide repeat protein [Flavobacteriales bacterium]|nr:tetratricopeptide repeat protein [Flavobacteriales bacterium]
MRTFLYLLFLFIIQLFVVSNSLAQMKGIDSLWSVWNDSSKPDTQRLESMKSLNRNYYLVVNADSAYTLAQQMYDFAERKNIKKYQGAALKIQGEARAYQSRLDEAIIYFEEALKIGKLINDKTITSGALNSIGMMNSWQGNYLKAIEYFTQSLQINMTDSTRYSSNIAKINLNIGEIFYDLGNFSKAKIYYEKAETILLNSENDSAGTKDLTLAGIWSSLGNVALIEEKPDKALPYFTKGKDATIKWNNLSDLSGFYTGIGDVHRTNHNYIETLINYKESLRLDEEFGDKYGMVRSLVNLSALYSDMQDYVYAKKYGRMAIKLSKDIKSIAPKIAATEVMIEVYRIEKNFKSALLMQESLIQLKDSIAGENMKNEINGLVAKYDYNRKAYEDSLNSVRQTEIVEMRHQQEVSEQKTYSLIAYSGIGALMLLIILGGIGYRQKKKSNLLLAEKNIVIEESLKDKEVLIKEIHHRVKNNMQMVSGLLQLNQRIQRISGLRKLY